MNVHRYVTLESVKYLYTLTFIPSSHYSSNSNNIVHINYGNCTGAVINCVALGMDTSLFKPDKCTNVFYQLGRVLSQIALIVISTIHS